MLFLVVLIGCQAAPNPSVEAFVPLPPPVSGNYPLSLTYSTNGVNQTTDLTSPDFSVAYRSSGFGIGGTANELVELPDGTKAVMLQVTWGDLWQGQVTRTEYYASGTKTPRCLIAGLIQVNVPNASILQWLRGLSNIRYEVDRSRLNLLYVAPKPCEFPQLETANYSEAWLGTNDRPLLMGSSAAWGKASLGFLPASYRRWGFWENHAKPFDEVSQLLAAARDGLDQKPDYLAVNTNYIVQLFGRREAFTVKRRGLDVGTITFDYRNGWGRGPNQSWIGNGAVSRIEWQIDGKYYALVELTPPLPIGDVPPSTLAVFVDDQKFADEIENRDDWVMLYDDLRNNRLPHAILGIHIIGDINDIYKDVYGTDSKGNPTHSRVKIGTGGGVAYSVLGNPSSSDIMFAHQLISALGYNGIKGLGLHYPSWPGSGNGLNFYVSTLRIITSDNPLSQFGNDVGTIDRVGFPSLQPLCWKCYK